MVTREWLEVAVKDAAQSEVVNIMKMEFEKISQVDHQ